jgi:hypothetical protein
LPCLIESLEQAFSWVGLKPCQARLGFLIMQGHGIMCTPKPLQEKKKCAAKRWWTKLVSPKWSKASTLWKELYYSQIFFFRPGRTAPGVGRGGQRGPIRRRQRHVLFGNVRLPPVLHFSRQFLSPPAVPAPGIPLPWSASPPTASQTRRRSKRPHLGLNPHVRRRLASPSIFSTLSSSLSFHPSSGFFFCSVLFCSALSVVCRPQLEASGVQTGSRFAGGGARQVGAADLDFVFV